MVNFVGEEEQPKSPAASDDEVLVRVENVSKKFCRSLKRSLWYGLQDATQELIGYQSKHTLRDKEFWAVQDVSFELRRGECLGLIGHNGAGKTTLLRILNGLIKPDHGRIEIYGEVSAMIALGSGFNPVLTGRENVFVQGAIQGLSTQDIQNKYDEIVDFAEISDFMEAPVQSYSSGMKARLGFACASTFNCDILLIDEVLAVGDFAFRQKCFRRLTQYVANGGSVILVSHALEQIIARTDRAILLEKGRIICDGSPRRVILTYESRLIEQKFSKAAINYWARETHFSPELDTSLELSYVRFLSTTPKRKCVICTNDSIEVHIQLNTNTYFDYLRLILSIVSQQEAILIQAIAELQDISSGTQKIIFKFPYLPLSPGIYPVQIRMHDKYNICLGIIDRKDFLLEIKAPEYQDRNSLTSKNSAVFDLSYKWEVETMIGNVLEGQLP
jgi:lipopolysaccharide transport system ATP-binding protein